MALLPTYLKSQVDILKYVGLWNDFEKPGQRLMYKVLSFLIIAPMIVQIIGGTVHLFLDTSELDISTINIIISTTAVLIKSFLFRNNLNGVRNVVEEINGMTGKNEKEIKTIKYYERRSKLLTIAFIFSGIICNLSICFGTLMLFYGFVSGEKRLILKAWYPFNVEQNIELVVLLQLCYGISICVTAGMIDTFIVCLMIHLGGQFQILSLSVEEMAVEIQKREKENKMATERINNSKKKFRVKVTGGAIETAAINRTSEAVKRSRDAKKLLRKPKAVNWDIAGTSRELHPQNKDITRSCTQQSEEVSYELLIMLIQRHELLLSVCRELQKVLSSIFFVQMLMSSIVLSLAIVKLTQINGLNFEMLSYVVYANIMLMEMGMYCVLGDYLRVKGEEVADAAYNTQWYQLSKYYNYSLRFLIQRAQKPVLLVGEGFFVLSRETFLQICMSSISYFMVLRKVLHEK